MRTTQTWEVEAVAARKTTTAEYDCVKKKHDFMVVITLDLLI